MDYSLSSNDILKLIDGKANLISYDSVYKYKSLDDLLGPHKVCIILYLTEHNYGHWVCLIKHGKKHIEFFDSYGTIPDDQLKSIDKDIRELYNQDHTYLIRLLLDSGYKVEYNHDQLQKYDTNTNSCGRHVAVRIIFKNMSLKKYTKMVKSYGDSDKLVYRATKKMI